MIKKFCFLAAVAVMAASCLKSGKNEISYQALATFELSDDYFDLENGDSIYCKQLVVYGDIYFMNKYDEETDEFGGFAVSCAHNSSGYNYPYSVALHKRYDTHDDGRLNRFLFWDYKTELMPEHDIVFSMSEYGTCTVVGCYVYPSSYLSHYAAMNGFGYSNKEDWVLLTATGYLNGAQTGTASIYLYDCREDKSLTTEREWAYFDLSDLGNVQYIDFEVTASKEEIPRQFCMDDFIANVHIVLGE